jgi:RNA polymerase sigma factor (sigma-70 family)
MSLSPNASVAGERRSFNMTATESEFVEKNRGLACHVALRLFNRFHPHGWTEDDMKQEAMLSLMRAAEGYDPRKGKVSSYIGQAVQNDLIKAIDGCGIIRIPRGTRAKARRLGLVVPTVPRQKGMPFGTRDQAQTPADVAEANDDKAYVRGLLARLDASANATRALLWRYGLEDGPSKLKEIGAAFGVTRQRAEQLVKEGLAELRTLAGGG